MIRGTLNWLSRGNCARGGHERKTLWGALSVVINDGHQFLGFPTDKIPILSLVEKNGYFSNVKIYQPDEKFSKR